jgi:hypothetical protein
VIFQMIGAICNFLYSIEMRFHEILKFPMIINKLSS